MKLSFSQKVDRYDQRRGGLEKQTDGQIEGGRSWGQEVGVFKEQEIASFQTFDDAMQSIWIVTHFCKVFC